MAAVTLGEKVQVYVEDKVVFVIFLLINLKSEKMTKMHHKQLEPVCWEEYMTPVTTRLWVIPAETLHKEYI